MEIKVQIPFQQLLTLIRSLSPSQKAKVKLELNEPLPESDKSTYINMLLSGPVYSAKDIDIIESNRKDITKWRSKS